MHVSLLAWVGYVEGRGGGGCFLSEDVLWFVCLSGDALRCLFFRVEIG